MTTVMEISEADIDSPAIRALGFHFKLTEIFLSDDGFSDDDEQRFKYDDDNDDDDSILKNSSNSSLETAEDSVVTANAELTLQMSELGLPLSFQSSRQKSGQTKAKNKATKLDNKHSQKISEDQVQGSSQVCEGSSCLADSQDISSNSSSSSLPHHIELSCSGLDASVDLPTFHLPVELGTEPISNNVFDNNAEQNEKNLDKSLTERVDIEIAEIGKNVVLSEELESSKSIEQAHVGDLSGESQNMFANNCDIDNIRCNDSAGDWSACWDSFYMRYYFCNAKTQESTWYPPPGMENFALGDYSVASSESKAELNEPNEEVPSFEKEQVDRCLLVYETGCDEQIGSETGSDKLCDSLKKETEEVNCGEVCHDSPKPMDLESTNLSDLCDCLSKDTSGNIPVESSSTSSSTSVAKAECSNSDINKMHQEDVEIIANDFDMQNTTGSTKRKKSRKTRRRKKSLNNNNDKGFQLVQDFDIDITKYWNQRYLLFSKFDHGIKMDEEGWFSVTPEAIARHHASRSGGGIVVDCFAGVGGNAIQFAKVSKQVIAIDIDSRRIDYAHHNAVIYGVEEKIDFIRGDCFSLAPKLIADTVFLSPPWGGPDYVKMDSYDINMLLPYDGQSLFNTFKDVASKIIMFLPKNVNVDQLAELSLTANTPWSLEVEKNFLNGNLKTVTAYYSKIS